MSINSKQRPSLDRTSAALILVQTGVRYKDSGNWLQPSSGVACSAIAKTITRED